MNGSYETIKKWKIETAKTKNHDILANTSKFVNKFKIWKFSFIIMNFTVYHSVMLLEKLFIDYFSSVFGVSCSLSLLINDEFGFLFPRVVHLFICLWRTHDDVLWTRKCVSTDV